MAPTDPPHPGGQEILAIVLDKPSRASELLLVLVNLAREGKLTIHDAVPKLAAWLAKLAGAPPK